MPQEPVSTDLSITPVVASSAGGRDADVSVGDTARPLPKAEGVYDDDAVQEEITETPTLFVCDGDDGGARIHPCRRVQEALRAADIHYEKVIAGHCNPLPFLRNESREHLRAATGATKLPALELPDGTIVTHSRTILAWIDTQTGRSRSGPRAGSASHRFAAETALPTLFSARRTPDAAKLTSGRRFTKHLTHVERSRSKCHTTHSLEPPHEPPRSTHVPVADGGAVHLDRRSDRLRHLRRIRRYPQGGQ
jgi:hypothetical protein